MSKIIMRMNKRGATLESVVLVFLAFLLLVAGGYFIYTSIYKPQQIVIAKIDQTIVDSVTATCQQACDTGLAKNLYCNEKQTIPYIDDNNKKQTLSASCFELARRKYKDGKDITLPANIDFPSCSTYNCEIPCQLKKDIEVTCSNNDIKADDADSAAGDKKKACNELVGCAFDESVKKCKAAASECEAVAEQGKCKDACEWKVA